MKSNTSPCFNYCYPPIAESNPNFSDAVMVT